MWRNKKARDARFIADAFESMADVEIKNPKPGELLLYDEERGMMVNKLPDYKLPKTEEANREETNGG